MSFRRTTRVLFLLVLPTGAAVASEGGGGMGKALITPHYGTVIWTVVTFLIMLFILSKYAWKPLLGALSEREDTIQGDLDQARREREEAEGALRDHRELVTEARRERAEALALGRADAEKLKAEILDQAKQERAKLMARTEAQVQASMRQARSELRGVAADLAIQAAEKLLSRSLDDASQRKLVEDHLAELEKSSGPAILS